MFNGEEKVRVSVQNISGFSNLKNFKSDLSHTSTRESIEPAALLFASKLKRRLK